MSATISMSETLNRLLNGELHAAHLYYQASAWCADRHLDGCSTLFLGHAGEELTHMRRFLDYMFAIDCQAVFTSVPAPNLTVETVASLFDVVLAHEKSVTLNVDAAVTEAQAASDHSTFEFLQWFVKEQREEEKLFRDLTSRITLIGEGPQALYFVDREVASFAHKTTD
jgi:ferritin